MFNLSLFATKLKRISQTNNTHGGTLHKILLHFRCMIWSLVGVVFLQPLNKLYNLIEIIYNSSIICQSVAQSYPWLRIAFFVLCRGRVGLCVASRFHRHVYVACGIVSLLRACSELAPYPLPDPFPSPILSLLPCPTQRPQSCAFRLSILSNMS